MLNPRGRIVLTNRAARIGSGKSTGRRIRLLIYVRTGSARFRKQWFQAQRNMAIEVLLKDENGQSVPVQAFGDAAGHPWITVFDVAGTPEAMEKLSDMPFVEEWHHALDVRAHEWTAENGAVSISAGGSGPEKQRQDAKHREPRAKPYDAEEMKRWLEVRDETR